MSNLRVSASIGVLLLVGVGAVQQATKPTVVTHDLAGRDNCLMCHSGAMPNAPGVPESHAERPNETCLWCHAADAGIQTATPPAIAHDPAGRENCMMCHSGTMPNVPGVPATHEGRGNEHCTMCHRPAG
jgi:hypothetical protein